MDEMQMKLWRARSDARSMILNEFWTWDEKIVPEAMPHGLALSTMGEGLDLCEAMLERLMKNNDPALLLKRLELWVAGIDAAKANLSGRVEPKAVRATGANLAGVIAKGFGERMAELTTNTHGDPDQIRISVASWLDCLPSLMQAGFRLENRLKLDGLAGSLPDRFARAAEQAIREPGLGSAWTAKSWIMVGADPLVPVAVDKGLQSRLGIPGRFNPTTWMETILAGQPSAWLFASFLCEAGASIGKEQWGAGRQLMNGALAERSGKLRGVSTQVRLDAVFAILSGMGLDVKKYRGKGGELFDEFALGALWANPSKELVEGLKARGVGFKDRSKQKMGVLAAKRLDADRNGMGRPTRESIEAVSSGQGVGPFNKGWASLARVACSRWNSGWQQDSNAKDWVELFAGLARDSKWSALDIAEIEAVNPQWAGQPALIAAKEAAQLRASVAQTNVSSKKSMSL